MALLSRVSASHLPRSLTGPLPAPRRHALAWAAATLLAAPSAQALDSFTSNTPVFVGAWFNGLFTEVHEFGTLLDWAGWCNAHIGSQCSNHRYWNVAGNWDHGAVPGGLQRCAHRSRPHSAHRPIRQPLPRAAVGRGHRCRAHRHRAGGAVWLAERGQCQLCRPAQRPRQPRHPGDHRPVGDRSAVVGRGPLSGPRRHHPRAGVHAVARAGLVRTSGGQRPHLCVPRQQPDGAQPRRPRTRRSQRAAQCLGHARTQCHCQRWLEGATASLGPLHQRRHPAPGRWVGGAARLGHLCRTAGLHQPGPVAGQRQHQRRQVREPGQRAARRRQLHEPWHLGCAQRAVQRRRRQHHGLCRPGQRGPHLLAGQPDAQSGRGELRRWQPPRARQLQCRQRQLKRWRHAGV